MSEKKRNPDRYAPACVLVRSGHEAVLVNLDIAVAEPNPEDVHWVDDLQVSP